MGRRRVGVLALQGAFLEHCLVLEDLGVEAVEVRLPEHLPGLDGIVIPGGESTTMSRLMAAYGLLQPLRDRARQGLPIMGTCAGMILLAKSVPGFSLDTLCLMDITVRRNAFGSQVDSFEADLDMPALGPAPFHAVFIRAPLIEEAGPSVEVLAKMADSALGELGPKGGASGVQGFRVGAVGKPASEGGAVVAARQGRLLAVAFHPELAADARLHRYFLDMAGS